MTKVSIITVSYNSVKTIEDTMKSVLFQTYPDIEYIVIDGGSTDGTVEIIKKYGDKVAKFVSEPDRGIYDAMNKGIKLAGGEIIGILNSDDFYVDGDVVKSVVEAMETETAGTCWGDLVYVKRDNPGTIVRMWESSLYEKGKFYKGWHPPHPTFFVRKKVYDRHGVFRLDMPVAADFEIMLRFLECCGVKGCYLPKVLVKMREGGNSNWRNFFSVLKGNVESYRSFKVNGLAVNPLFMMVKPLTKISQLWKKYW